MLTGHDVISLVPIRDAEAARAFYEETLGLRFIADDGFAVVFEVNGRFLRLTRVPELTPQPFSIIGWMVPDIAASAAALRDAGVELVRYDFMQQDALGVWTAPDGSAKVAWFHDPEGNLLSIVEAAHAAP